MKLRSALGKVLFIPLILLFSTYFCFANSQDDITLRSIIMEGVNTSDALNIDSAIKINPNIGSKAKLEYTIKGNQTVEIDYLKTVFIVADIDTVSEKDDINEVFHEGGNFTYIQTWKFNNYVINEKIALITGAYMLRYDLYYSVNGQKYVVKSTPFFIEFDANPVSSVFGIVSTLALATTSISYIGLANSLRGSVNLEFENSIGQTKVSPSEKLLEYYQGTSYSIAQSEVSNVLFGYASQMWMRDKCPQCQEDWPKDTSICPSCQLTAEEAKKLFSASLVEKSLNAIKEVVDSVSGLSLKGIADNLDEGIMPTSSIICVLTFSGLTLVQPRVSQSWSKKQRKLVFTGLSNSIYALFWMQACGLGVVSLTALTVAVLSGLVISYLLSYIAGMGLRSKIRAFWENKETNVDQISDQQQ
jgi:hypothetical protein